MIVEAEHVVVIAVTVTGRLQALRKRGIMRIEQQSVDVFIAQTSQHILPHQEFGRIEGSHCGILNAGGVIQPFERKKIVIIGACDELKALLQLAVIDRFAVAMLAIKRKTEHIGVVQAFGAVVAPDSNENFLDALAFADIEPGFGALKGAIPVRPVADPCPDAAGKNRLAELAMARNGGFI